MRLTPGSDRRVYRAAVVTPLAPQRWWACADAAVVVEGGRIEAVAPMARLREVPASAVEELDGVLLPGFIDVHIHWVQHHVRGRFGGHLMPWLRNHIWPQEAAFADVGLARSRARMFFHDMLRAGTVGGLAYGSPHPEATAVAAEEARGHWRLGEVLMDAGDSPLARATPDVLADARASLAALGAGRYVLSPRFAPSSSAALLAGVGRLAAATGCMVQTHLAEDAEEIAVVRAAFADALDYTDVYERAGLVGPRSVFGHCLHLSPREWARLSESGAWVAHCPSSNEALDSGVMDLAAVRRHGVRWALGSDVGAGPSHSMLHVMQRFLAQHRARGVPVTAQETLYRASRAGADCLGLEAVTGAIEPGRRADMVLFPGPATRRFVPAGWLEDLLQGPPAALEARATGVWLAGKRVFGATGDC